jgi:hypothetical protein
MILYGDFLPIIYIVAVFMSHWVCRSVSCVYLVLHTQWDMKSAAIYKLGRKSS